MSVNTMEFKDAAAILNNIRKQVTGETAIAPANTAEFVSVATTMLSLRWFPEQSSRSGRTTENLPVSKWMMSSGAPSFVSWLSQIRTGIMMFVMI